MRALVCNEYGPPETLNIEQRDDPVPGEFEVLVEVRAAGINFPDLLVISGNYQVKTPPPFVPGSETAGVVGKVGSGVTRFKPGDRVIATPINGGFAEKCLVPEKFCLPLPASMSFEAGGRFHDHLCDLLSRLSAVHRTAGGRNRPGARRCGRGGHHRC